MAGDDTFENLCTCYVRLGKREKSGSARLIKAYEDTVKLVSGSENNYYPIGPRRIITFLCSCCQLYFKLTLAIFIMTIYPS